MTDAPERIWTYGEFLTENETLGKAFQFPVCYTRTDLIPAMLSAARREALEEAVKIAETDLNADLVSRMSPAWLNGYAAAGGEIAFRLRAAAIRALAASPPTPAPVDRENAADPVGKGGVE